MKYLRKFINESRINIASSEKIEELCKDSIIELLEEGFFINIKKTNILARPSFELSIHMTGSPFKWKSISDKIINLIENLRYDFEVKDDFEFWVKSSGKINLTFEEILNKNDFDNYDIVVIVVNNIR